MDNTVFKLKDVYFSYLGRYPALCGVSLGILKGEKVTVMGANGMGKSTLLAMLDGILFPDSGEIAAFGRKLDSSSFEDREFSCYFRSRVGFVFQNPDIQLFCPTVKDDIVFGPLQMGVSPKEAMRRLDESCGLLGIGHLLERPAYRLSIGEKRKVAIASVLAMDPEVLIFDEPTAGLDPLTSRHILDIILEANQSGKTIITATHDLHLVSEISDAVYLLTSERRIRRYDDPEVFLGNQELLKENNLVHIHGHRHKGKLHVHEHEHLEHRHD